MKLKLMRNRATTEEGSNESGWFYVEQCCDNNKWRLEMRGRAGQPIDNTKLLLHIPVANYVTISLQKGRECTKNIRRGTRNTIDGCLLQSLGLLGFARRFLLYV